MSERRVNNDVIFAGQVDHLYLPRIYGTTSKGAGTIDVSGVTNLVLENTGIQNVTRLNGGVDFQPLAVRGDGNTTFQVTDNITTSTGAAKLLAANKVYRFTYYADILKWVEDG